MQNYLDPYRAVTTYNEYFVKLAVDYWTAVSYPALYLAKYL